jgi:hypothetical protein
VEDLVSAPHLSLRETARLARQIVEVEDQTFHLEGEIDDLSESKFHVLYQSIPNQSALFNSTDINKLI